MTAKQQIKGHQTGIIGQNNSQDSGGVGVEITGIMKGIGLGGWSESVFRPTLPEAVVEMIKLKSSDRTMIPEIENGNRRSPSLRKYFSAGLDKVMKAAGKHDHRRTGLRPPGSQSSRARKGGSDQEAGPPFVMARKFMADMKTSNRLSRPDEATAMEPDSNPTENLLPAKIKAELMAKREAFCFISMEFQQQSF